MIEMAPKGDIQVLIAGQNPTRLDALLPMAFGPQDLGLKEGAVPVREVRLSAGAGFVVIICGEIMTMPGLPKAPSSEKIFLNEQGQIEGLF